MNCNTLANTTKHFLDLGLMKEARVVDMADYDTVKEEIKRLQDIATQEYGVADALFNLEVLTRPVVSWKGNFTNVRLTFNVEAFKKLDTAVEEKSTETTEEVGQLSFPFEPMEEAKAIEYVYNGEIYNTEYEMEEAKKYDTGIRAFSPSLTDFNATNYANVVEYKELLLKGVTKRLNNTVAQRKYDKSDSIKAEIAKLNNLKTKIEGEIYELKNDPAIFEKTMAVFNTDINLIDSIFAAGTPSIENIHFAEEMINYFDMISNYSATNNNNTFVNVSDPALIETDVREALDKLRSKNMEQKTKLLNAKKEYLLRAVDKSQQLKALFPNKQLEEIRDMLLEDKSDIGLISMLFGTVEEDFSGNETLLASLIRKTLEDSRNKNKSFASNLIQSINYLQDPVKKKLIQMGYGLSIKGLNSVVSEVDYTLFYQKTARNNKTGRLVNKFSHKWFTEIASFTRANNDVIDLAYQAKDFSAMNQALVSKYTWLNEKADFIDLGRLPEIAGNKDFKQFSSHFNLAEANAYKQELIAKIGEYEYEKLVQHQTELVEDYINNIRHELSARLDAHGVATPADLPVEAIHSFNIYAKRNSPFEFMDSHKSGQQGRVDYKIDNTGNQYQSHLKYNTYIPKTTLQRVDFNGITSEVESDFYDKDFSKIEADNDLMEFWKVLSEATLYMNSTLNDANTTLGHSSLLRMAQSTTDVLLDKENGSLNKTVGLLRETGQSVKDLFSAKDKTMKADDMSDVSKGRIQTIQQEVNDRYKVITMKLNTILKTTLDSKARLELAKMPIEVIEVLEAVTDKSKTELMAEYGTHMAPSVLKEYLTNQVMQEQTFNLPVMMRAYLDMVSEYKAQKEALPEISIYKGLYDTVNLEKEQEKNSGNPVTRLKMSMTRNIRKLGLEDKRWMAQLRMKHWVNKNVKGVTDAEAWGKIGGKNYNQKEKEFKKEAEAYLESLKERLANTADADEEASLINEIDEVTYALDNIGKVYALSAIYDNVINRLSIFVGLGYNVKAQVINRFQGWWQGMINDTGRYWPEGAFYASNAFINRKGLRRLPGAHSYRNEIRKTKLMIEKLNTLQDATNELDRAKRDSGIRGKTKVLNPFYLTEYVEWHNQVPQILAILMGQQITDSNGNSVPVFDGTSFPAFIIDKGHLVLKPEFDTEDNRATWVDFSNQASSDMKTKISQTIAILNGDYSKTGGTLVKSKAVGRTLMMFKTWLPKQIMMRFGSNQTDLALGLQDFDGAYTGALKTSKSRTAATAALTTGIGVTATMGLGLGFAVPMAAGLIGYTAYQNYRAKKDGENLDTMKQLSLAGQALIKKAVGLPVNTLAGKDLIKAQNLDELGLTPQEKQNLHFIINEITGLLYLTLMKVMIKAMYQDGDDEEPKTIFGQPNPYLYKKRQSDEEKAFYNLMENNITRSIDDVTLFMNPDGLYTSMMHPAGMDGWFKKVQKISDGLKRTAVTDNDMLTSGENAGKSKLGTALKEAFLPGIFNEWMDGDVSSITFGKQMKKDFKPDEVMDYWFKSDYAKDRKKISSERAEKREELTDYWQGQFKYDEATPETRVFLDSQINKMINQELKYTNPTDIRANYDINQNKIK